MLLEEAEEVFEYWEEYPPVYQMVGIIAQMLGWKPRHRPGDPGAFAAWPALASAGFTEQKTALASAAVYDFDELKRQFEAKRAS